MLAAVVTNGCRKTPVATWHCPKCQGVKRAQWLQARLERLLPVEHFRAARPAISTVFCNERKSTVLRNRSSWTCGSGCRPLPMTAPVWLRAVHVAKGASKGCLQIKQTAR